MRILYIGPIIKKQKFNTLYIMKKTILTLVMSVSIMFTMAADLYVNGSGNANTYPTIQGAVNASSSGDNIYVATVGTYSENVTITNKSLFIIAAVADEEFTLSGSFTLSPGTGNEVTIIGMYNGNVTCSGYGTSNLISSFISSISGSSSGGKLNVYDCEVTNSFTIYNGSVKGNVIDRLVVNSASGANGDTIRIMGNYMTSLDWNSSMAYFEICNNYINGQASSSFSQSPVTIDYLQATPGGTNLIANNTIDFSTSSTSYNRGGIVFSSSVSNGQNLVIANNYLKNTYNNYAYAINANYGISNALIANNQYYSGYFSIGLTGSSLVDNGTSSVSWTYNSTTGVLTSGSNMGLDQIEYRDINNTRNDIGTSGGPHAWSNYNTTTGKAAVFNLELPFQLYIGGNHNIKAKGFHKN
jgi:hypothetical protein